MKKIILLFAMAVASFLLFSYIDEYENLILPFIRGENPGIAVQSRGASNEIKSTLDGFINNLEKAYLSSDPSPLRLIHIDDRLYSSISQEIDYLRREGRVMELDVKEVSIEKVEALSRDIVRVTTSERVGVRYLNTLDSKETLYPDAMYVMVYTIAVSGSGLKIVNYETVGAKPKEKN